MLYMIWFANKDATTSGNRAILHCKCRDQGRLAGIFGVAVTCRHSEEILRSLRSSAVLHDVEDNIQCRKVPCTAVFRTQMAWHPGQAAVPMCTAGTTSKIGPFPAEKRDFSWVCCKSSHKWARLAAELPVALLCVIFALAVLPLKRTNGSARQTVGSCIHCAQPTSR